ncbi:hypothetical protein LA6_001107 [Marinibacterium anthonyi]|nr:hypothetical protein LA6_001107 [Marinibacterium anthonyi]
MGRDRARPALTFRTPGGPPGTTRAGQVHRECDLAQVMALNRDLMDRDVLPKWHNHGRLNGDTARRVFLRPDAVRA